jgi:hypothetical protein
VVSSHRKKNPTERVLSKIAALLFLALLLMRRKDDLLWKGLLEDVFDDFLRFIFPDAGQLFDMQKGFHFMDKELVEMYPQPDQKSNTRFVDKLVKVYKLDGSQECLLIHVEVQGQTDKDFPERMFRYYCGISDRFQIPVTAIAVFTMMIKYCSIEKILLPLLC